MPGLVPGIHVFAAGFIDVDGRDKPGHDGIFALLALAAAARLYVVAVGSVPLAVGCHLHASPEGEDDESDQDTPHKMAMIGCIIASRVSSPPPATIAASAAVRPESGR